MTQHHQPTHHEHEYVIPTATLARLGITAEQLTTPHQGPATHVHVTTHSTTPPTPHPQHDAHEHTRP